jgi:hypothetical protein
LKKFVFNSAGHLFPLFPLPDGADVFSRERRTCVQYEAVVVDKELNYVLPSPPPTTAPTNEPTAKAEILTESPTTPADPNAVDSHEKSEAEAGKGKAESEGPTGTPTQAETDAKNENETEKEDSEKNESSREKEAKLDKKNLTPQKDAKLASGLNSERSEERSGRKVIQAAISDDKEVVEATDVANKEQTQQRDANEKEEETADAVDSRVNPDSDSRQVVDQSETSKKDSSVSDGVIAKENIGESGSGENVGDAFQRRRPKFGNGKNAKGGDRTSQMTDQD